MKGYIEADKIETITIRYLPGIPKKFTKNLKLQISHFAPEDIVIKGEAGFADIMLDLPRFENDIYKALRRVSFLIKVEHFKIQVCNNLGLCTLVLKNILELEHNVKKAQYLISP